VETIGLINGFELCKFRWLSAGGGAIDTHLLLHLYNCPVLAIFV